MQQYLNQLRDVQVRLSGYQEGLDGIAERLNSPFVALLVDELEQATRAIDFAVSQLSRPKTVITGKCGSVAISDYDQIMTDGL